MPVKITTLIENNPGEHLGLKSEHGLSFFIEKDEYRILFDTGQSGAFIANSKQLKADLGFLDFVVLSHGHYDHSRGLRFLAEVTTDFKLIMGQGFFDEKYGVKNNTSEYLGNNFDEQFLADQKIAYQFVDQQLTELLPNVYVVTGFPRIHEDEKINPRFMVNRNGIFQADCFDDEILLAIDSSEGLVVILGCSHPGMKNMLDSAVNLLKRPLYAVVGGTHLVESSKSSLQMSMDYLQSDTLKVIGVSHCTGKVAMDQLEASNDRFYLNRTGSTLLIS